MAGRQAGGIFIIKDVGGFVCDELVISLSGDGNLKDQIFSTYILHIANLDVTKQTKQFDAV